MLVGAVVLCVVLLTALLGLGLTRDPRALDSPLVGKPAPDFALRTLDGPETIRLSQFAGHAVVINFWASWCTECRIEHPDLVAAWRRYGDRGVVFLGIVYQDTVPNARAFVREMGGGWPSLLDPGGRTALQFGVYGVPETFFIAPDGTVAHRQVGPSTFRLLSSWIRRLEQRSPIRGENGR